MSGFPPPPPPSPIRRDPCLRLILTATESYITFSLADFFLKKRALHFAASLNSRDIQECNWFGVPSYDLFALLAKQYFPRQRRPTFTDWETRGRLFEKWFATKKFNSPFRTKVWIPQGKTPGSAPELGSVEAFNWKWEKVLTFNCYNARKALEYVIVKRACFRKYVWKDRLKLACNILFQDVSFSEVWAWTEESKRCIYWRRGHVWNIRPTKPHKQKKKGSQQKSHERKTQITWYLLWWSVSRVVEETSVVSEKSS